MLRGEFPRNALGGPRDSRRNVTERLTSADGADDLEPVAGMNIGRGVAAARDDLAVLFDGNLLAREAHPRDDVGNRPRVVDIRAGSVDDQARHCQVRKRTSASRINASCREKREQATHAHRSVGAQLVNSPEYKAWHEAGGMRSVQSGFLYTIKAAITSTDTTDTRTVGVPTDEQPLLPLPMRALRVRDLLMPGRTSSNAISYVQQTGFTNNAAVVSEAPTRKPER